MARTLEEQHAHDRKVAKDVVNTNYDNLENLESALQQRIRERKALELQQAKAVFFEILIYCIYLIITIMKATFAKEFHMFYSNHIMRAFFTYESVPVQFGKQVKFENLLTTSDFWDYAEKIYLPRLFEGSEDKELETVLGGNFLLGPPRLRQIRVNDTNCDKKFYSKVCYPFYSVDNENRARFQGVKYRTDDQLKTTPLSGRLSRFEGGGFVVQLTKQLNTSLEILKDLKKNYWIDRGTRLVILELSVYNNNVRLFNNIKILMEMDATSGIKFKSEIHATRLHSTWTYPRYYFGWFVNIVYCGLHIFYTQKQIREISRIGCIAFFSKFWSWFDTATNTLMWFCWFYEFWHTYYVYVLLERFENYPLKFLSIDILTYWNEFYLKAIALATFFTMVKLLKFLSLNKTLLQFSTTFRRCSRDLIGFFLMFLMILFAYCLVGTFMFGVHYEEFNTFHHAIYTMVRILVGSYDFRDVIETDPILAPIFFISYILLVYFILMNFFLAIIILTYAVVKSEIQSGKINIETVLGELLLDIVKTVFFCFFKNGKLRKIFRKKEPEGKKEGEDEEDELDRDERIRRAIEAKRIQDEIDRTATKPQRRIRGAARRALQKQREKENRIKARRKKREAKKAKERAKESPDEKEDKNQDKKAGKNQDPKKNEKTEEKKEAQKPQTDDKKPNAKDDGKQQGKSDAKQPARGPEKPSAKDTEKDNKNDEKPEEDRKRFRKRNRARTSDELSPEEAARLEEEERLREEIEQLQSDYMKTLSYHAAEIKRLNAKNRVLMDCLEEQIHQMDRIIRIIENREIKAKEARENEAAAKAKQDAKKAKKDAKSKSKEGKEKKN